MGTKTTKSQTKSLTVVVQEICTVWTKTSRGGEQARLRNCTPERIAITVNSLPLDGRHIIHQYVLYGERTAFQRTKERIQIDTMVQPFYGCTNIDYNWRKGVWATYTYSREQGGAPDRGNLQKKLFAPLNQWVQMCENGRFPPIW